MVLTGLPLNIDFQQILLHLANFAILFFGLYILLYKPVVDFMKKREEHYKAIDDEAMGKLAEAENKEKEYSNRLETCDAEIAAKMKKAEDEMNEARLASQKAAKDKADKLIEEAREAAEAEKKGILKRAEKEITDMVSAAAEKIMLSDDITKAYDEFLSDAERSAKHG
ncbi:MAG: ATP synthase F0 subunit B [Lachnospiraceae bacterium]|nr:ATP synthase F0 subunit B [Lachnospiraceae bacterium]